MKRFFALAATFAVCGTFSLYAQAPGGTPQSDECHIDICVIQDVDIECISEEIDCVQFLIGEEKNLCQEFKITGGGGMNITVDCEVESGDINIAELNAATAEYGHTQAYGSNSAIVGTDPGPFGAIYSTTLSGGDHTVEGSSFLRICTDVEATGAGTTSIVYHATVTDYTF